MSKYELRTYSLKQHKDSLIQQANYIAELLLLSKTTDWSKSDKDCYVISTQWFNKWDKYVNFAKQFKAKKKGTETAQEDKSEEPPGEIANQHLLVDDKEFYHNYSNEHALCNYNIKDTTEIKKDYYIVTKEIWTYLQSIYNGYELKRDCIYFGKNGIIRPDIMMSKVNIVIINKQWLQYKSPKKIYFYSNYTFKLLKQHIIQTFKFMQEKKESQVRLWRLEGSFDDFSKSCNVICLNTSRVKR